MSRRRPIPKSVRYEVQRLYGDRCWLGLPGCTGRGEEDDHIVPFAHGGRATVANIRRACKHCNSMRQDRVLSGYGATLHAVIGPPSADLMGYVESAAGRDSIVVSHHELMLALCPEGLYPRPCAALRSAAAMAWDAAYRRLAKERLPVDVWLVRNVPATSTHPAMLDEWIALDYDVHIVDMDSETVFSNCEGDPYMLKAARKWYSLHLSQRLLDSRAQVRRGRLAELGLRAEPATASCRVSW